MEDSLELHTKIEHLFLLVEELSATHDISVLPKIEYILEQIADMHNTTLNELDRGC